MAAENPGEALVKSIKDLPHDAHLALMMSQRKSELVGPKAGWKTPVDDLIAEDTDPALIAARRLVVNPVALILPTPFLRALSCFDRWILLDL